MLQARGIEEGLTNGGMTVATIVVFGPGWRRRGQRRALVSGTRNLGRGSEEGDWEHSDMEGVAILSPGWPKW